MILLVTNLIFQDFMKFSRKRPCIKSSIIGFNFIKLPIKCILNLAAILRRQVLQVSLRPRSNFKRCLDRCFDHQFYRDINANNLQSQYRFHSSVIFSGDLTNGDYIRYSLEKLTRENKVIAAVKKWIFFQF